MNKKQKRSIRLRRIKKNLPTIFMVLIGLSLIGYFVAVNFIMKSSHSIPPAVDDVSCEEDSCEDNLSIDSFPTASPEILKESTEEAVKYPTDKLFITKGRQEYTDEEIILRVPRLNLVTPVLNGTDLKTMAKGVCLFEYAQLPGKGNYNVSMIAHRNMEFEFIDTIKKGDLVYLQYKGMEYTYEYEETRIVKNDDWSIIYCTDHPIVTLVSCHPRHSSQNRMAVIARFISGRKMEVPSDVENQFEK